MCVKLSHVLFLTVMLGLVAGAGNDVTEGLVSHWKLSDGQGTVAADEIGGHDGQLMGDPVWTPGVIGGAIQLDGDGDYIDCGNDEAFNRPTNGITLAAWVLPDAEFAYPDWSGIIMRGGNVDADTYALYYNGSSSNIGFKTTGTSSSWMPIAAPDLLNGEWHHIAATYNGAMKIIYFDGASISSLEASGPIQTSDLRLLLGAGRDLPAPTHLFVGQLDDARLYDRDLSVEELQIVMQAADAPPEKPSNPSPDDGDEDVLRDPVLTWKPGISAVTHSLYVGATFDDVNTATAATASDLDVNSFDPGRLEFGATYYWRVDEVNGTPDKTVFKGDIWSFTVEPISIQIPGASIVATASSSSNAFSPPIKTIDGSGLDGDTHSTSAESMWFTAPVDLDPWIQYEFDSIRQLDSMKIWNSNGAAEMALGWGVKDVQIEYSLDGENWDVLPDANQFSRAPGSATYNQYDTIAFGGVPARFVRFDIQSNWGGILMSYSLSEIQFMEIPAAARQPVPADGAGDVLLNTVVTWRAGREADLHTLYMSTDPNAVADGSATSVSSNTNSLDLGPFDLHVGTAYYWRVDEVNEAEAMSVWAGPMWSFNTPAALTVDDFENYTNVSPDRPFQTWIDGYGYSADEFFPLGNPGNGSGSGVGYDIWSLSSPYYNGKIMEQTIAKSGQSMPVYYNNASQIDRAFATPQDWSANGIQTLVINFRGTAGNTGGPLYVKINNKKVTYPDNTDLSQSLWQQWNIDLASLGINLKAVTSMTIGIEGTGSGVIYVDDILLY